MLNKNKIANRIISRAEGSLYLVSDLLDRYDASDAVYNRSFNILLSYSFELVLKAAVVSSRVFKDKDVLKEVLKSLNHDIVKISNELGSNKLRDLGIERISRRCTPDFIGYEVQMTNGGKIVVEDFIDIRYDFTKDHLRPLPKDEDFKMWVEEAHKVLKEVKKFLRA